MGHSPDQILAVSLSGPLAFVFPGQGSQSLGMLSEWEDFPIVRQTFDEVSDALGYNVWELTQSGPAEKLNQTEYTQVALLTAGVAMYRLWCSSRPERPVLLAGHSLGEYTALVCGGALNLVDAAVLVRERGRLMQQAVPQNVGAMAAIIGLTDLEVAKACLDAKLSTEAKPEWVVEPANYNSPQQVVIAGLAPAVAKAMECAKAMGAKRVIPLTVSVPSHCGLMKQSSEALAKVLGSIPLRLPSIPVLHNVDATSHTSLEGIRQALVRQLYSPVRWVECIQKMVGEGINTIVECGPAAVLTGLNKRIAPGLNNISVS